MMTWIDKKGFFTTINKSIERLIPIDFCEFGFNSKDISNSILIDPDTESEEFTDPGPCLKWFAISSEFFFQITSYLVKDEFSLITVYLPDSYKPNWMLLKKIDLPFNFISNLNYVKGLEKSFYSVFCVDSNALSYELYRAGDMKEAESFKDYLRKNNFDRKLFIDVSENLTNDWVAEREGKIIARYGSRYATEKFALKQSKIDNLLIKVFSVVSENKYSIFVNGNLIERVK